MVTIENATEDDFPGILHILHDHLITNRPGITNEQLAQTGFFISPFTSEDLRSILADKENNILLVAKKNNTVCGYMLGHDLHHKNPQWLTQVKTSPDIQSLLQNQKVFYHRHIGVLRKPNEPEMASGVAKLLMSRMLGEVKGRGYRSMVCQIITAPIENKRSLLFHDRFGFKQEGLGLEGDKTFGLFLKRM